MEGLRNYDFDNDFRIIGKAAAAWDKAKRMKFKVSFISKTLSRIK